MKKNIPYAVLKTLEPFVGKNGDLYESVTPDNTCLMFFRDKDKNSKFYFKIEKQEVDQNSLKLLIEMIPSDQNSVAGSRTTTVRNLSLFNFGYDSKRTT